MKSLVIIEESATCFGAYVPDLPGRAVVGETREEVLHLDGMARLFERDMAPFRLASHKADSLKRTDRLAPRNPGEACHTRTSTWLVNTSGSAAISSWRATLR